MTDQQLTEDQERALAAFQKAMVNIYKFAMEEFAKNSTLKNYEIISLRAEKLADDQKEISFESLGATQDIDDIIRGKCRPCPGNPNACCFG